MRPPRRRTCWCCGFPANGQGDRQVSRSRAHHHRTMQGPALLPVCLVSLQRPPARAPACPRIAQSCFNFVGDEVEAVDGGDTKPSGILHTIDKLLAREFDKAHGS